MFKSTRLAAVLFISAAFVAAATNSLPRVSASSRLPAVSPLPGAVASYSVLSGASVTNSGPTTLSGNLGVSPGIGSVPHISGFPPGIVITPGVIHDADADAAAAQANSTALFGAIDQPCTATYPGVQDLTLLSPLAPGVYCALGSFSLTGQLVLSGVGVWIFKTPSTLITSPGSSVTGGDPCNVWWRVNSSATLDTGSSLMGNLLALTSITLKTGARLNGRALAQTGAVTLDSNAISLVCNTLTGTNVATQTATSVATITPTRALTTTPVATNTPTPARVEATTQPPAIAVVAQATLTPTRTPTATPVLVLPVSGAHSEPIDDLLVGLPAILALIAGGAAALTMGWIHESTVSRTTREQSPANEHSAGTVMKD